MQKYLWMMFFFFGLLIICIITMIACVLNVALHLQRLNAEAMSSTSLTLFTSMGLYPLEMIGTVSSCGSQHCRHFNTSPPISNDCFLEACLILASQYGTALAITYYTQTREARYRWARLLGCRSGEVEDRNSLPSEVSADVRRSETELMKTQYTDQRATCSHVVKTRLIDWGTYPVS